MTQKRLERLAAKAKDLIQKAESGRVDAYGKAGHELIAAKTAVRQAGLKWGEWLEEHGIPQRTATRAMQYAKNPDKYREERIKDALTKREKAKKRGQNSGQKRALLNIVQEATDAEIEAIYLHITTNIYLERLRHMIPEEFRSKANPSSPAYARKYNAKPESRVSQAMSSLAGRHLSEIRNAHGGKVPADHE